jgi:hypothetical protein
MSNLSFLQKKIQQSGEMDFNDVFSKCFDLFKKVWVQGVLLQLFTVIVMLPIIIIIYLPLIGIMLAQMRDGNYNTDAVSAFFAGFSILYIIFMIASFLILGAVTMALKAGFYRIIMKLDHNQDIAIADFFYFLKSNYLSKAFTLVIFTMLISVPAILLCVLPIFYVMVPLAFFSVIFAYNPELNPSDILNISFKLGNKKWLLVFGFMMIVGLILWILSYITCGISNIILTSFIYLPMYFVYKHCIGFDHTDESDNIGLIEDF